MKLARQVLHVALLTAAYWEFKLFSCKKKAVLKAHQNDNVLDKGWSTINDSNQMKIAR